MKQCRVFLMAYQRLKQRLYWIDIVTICLIVFILVLLLRPLFSNSYKNFEGYFIPSVHSIDDLRQIAEAITVKVSSKEFLGSATVIKRDGEIYTIVTSAHVIISDDPPYQIKTQDGRIYQALENTKYPVKDIDLAFLKFRSKTIVYPIANMENESILLVGAKVFVGGFVPDVDKPIREKFRFTVGQISLILDKPLKGGYQLGYTNDIYKGMSGAAILNDRGHMIGVNGLHKNPIWNTPDLYADGSEPSKSLQDLISRVSLAVPIKQILQNTPR
jgi:S1-C subfamily serine protease